MPKTGVDYATDQITVYRSPCTHQCRYCWLWRLPLFANRVQRGRYDPVEEARKYLSIKTPRTIVVSFVNDPYMLGVEYIEGKTREVLEVLAKAKWHRVLVLTKNPLLAVSRDLEIYMENPHIWLGTTITTLDKDKAGYWEPRAPRPSLRLEALRTAHEHGVKTWISIEPIIPETTYPEDIVRETIGYVDWYVLGAFNYAPQLGYTEYSREVLRSWYREHVAKALALLEEAGKPYHVKKELKPYLEEAES